MHNYDWLISRLDAFIRKYYANKVIRGTLVFLSCLLFFVLTVSVSEYYLYMPVWARLTIVSCFLVSGISSLVAWVVIPVLQMGKLGKIISHEQAANIIGRHFPEISDKLLNILQLKRHPDNNSSRELAEAGINQKINNISIVPISAAVDFSKNKKYLPYLLPLLLAGIIILITAPKIFSESSKRLLQPTKPFERPSPFQFIIKNSTLTATRNSDFILVLETKGSQLPADVFIETGDEKMPMQVLENHTFQFTFRNITDPVNFRFYGAGFYSSSKMIKVVQKPLLKAFKVQLNYPAYTGKKNETRTSLGDMTVPAGTTVSWGMMTEFTDNATIRFGNGSPVSLLKSATVFACQYRFLSDTSYTITLTNKQSDAADSYHYQVQVIPDQYPVIQIQQYKDTVSGKQILITGSAGDDYGITRVTFNYEISDNNKTITKNSKPVAASSGALATFQQYFDIESLNLQPGQKLTYYIEAWDNDGVHGNKASRSEVMTYQMYDSKQIDSAINENSQQINTGISNSAEQTKQLQSDYKDMQTKMLQSESLDWEQQQSLQEMLKKQLDLKAKVENIKQRFDEQMKQTEKKDYSDAIKEKQQDLEKQLDNMLNQELKDALKKLQEMMQKLNKEQALDAMKQIEQENKLFKMDMERMQALMNKMELQMRMEDMANKLDELAKKQMDLKDQTENNKKNDKELVKEQKDLKDKLAKAMKDDMKEMDKLAKESKEEKALDEPKEQGKEAEDEMKQSEEQIEQKQNSKAGKSQDKAAKKMKDMAQTLREKSGGMDIDEIDIDIKATRQVLSNLIRLSFDQEDLMASVRHTSTSSQGYVANQDEQNRLHKNSIMIRDSLFSLSKRVSKMSATINKETTDLEHNMQLTVDEIENRNTFAAIAHQQYVMTHTNNLALNLNELLASLMQMQMPPQDGGSAGSCKKPGGQMPKPGGKKPKPGAGMQLSDIITEQQQLGDAMQQMQQRKGKKPGEKDGDKPGNKDEKPGQGQKPGQGKGHKPGQGNGEGGGGSNGNKNGSENDENGDPEQLARLAEQQATLRHKIQELSSLLNSKGLGGNAKELSEIEQKMDKNETDLVNRKLNSDLLMRQKDILTRLLETDKALRQQEQDDKRSSKTSEDLSRPIPAQLQKYVTDRKQLLELYKTVPPQLKPYYRDMVDNYFQIIGNRQK